MNHTAVITGSIFSLCARIPASSGSAAIAVAAAVPLMKAGKKADLYDLQGESL